MIEAASLFLNNGNAAWQQSLMARSRHHIANCLSALQNQACMQLPIRIFGDLCKLPGVMQYYLDGRNSHFISNKNRRKRDIAALEKAD